MTDIRGVYEAMMDFEQKGPAEAGNLAGLCLAVWVRLCLQHGYSEAEVRSDFDDELEKQSPRREN